jgi:tetratricopeptide (TPR) repeat protein
MRKITLGVFASLYAASSALSSIAMPDPDALLLRGESLRVKANYPQAEKSVRQAIGILESGSQSQPERLSGAYNYLSLIENNTGKYADAEKHARLAIELAKTANLGEDAVAMHSVVLANALRQQAKYVEAEQLLQDALAVLDKPSTNRALLAAAQNNLGAIYFWRGNYAKAVPLLQKGLETRIKALGPDHVDVANSYLDLGATEFKIGETAKAIDHLSQSMRIRKKVLGTKHPETLAAQATLAVILESQGATTDASTLLAEVVSQGHRSLGRAHPDLAQYEDDYANVLAVQKRFDEARSMQTDAMNIRKEVFGPASREYAASLRSLAQIESAAGSANRAGQLLKESAVIYKGAGQAGDPDYADTLDALATYYVSAGDLPAASNAFGESAAIRNQSGPTVAGAVTYANLADVLSRMGRQTESLDALKKAKDVIDALPEPLKATPDCLSILERLKER